VKGNYPLYAMPVPTLLSLDRWVPHQDLRDAGKVVEMTPELLKQKDVIFVSHQWVAFGHPDPAGEQLRVLQRTISNLLNGKHVVESNSTLNTVYGTMERLTPEMWQARLPEMLVWFDYISSACPAIPAIPARTSPGASSAEHCEIRRLSRARISPLNPLQSRSQARW
jgi:hypothetical protein